MSDSDERRDEVTSHGGGPYAERTPPFEFTDDRAFELYIEQRKAYIQGARDAYQRFDQTIVALSGGSIILSVSFMKDLGFLPPSLPCLFASWGCFVIATLCAFISLLTSGEGDRERVNQLELLVNTGISDETRADRLGRVTARLNYSGLVFCIAGVLLIIAFGTYNLIAKGEQQWPKEHRPSTVPPPRPAPASTQAPAPGPETH
jgi:hypothetical protein